MGLAQGCNEVHEQKKLPMIRLQKEGEDQSREAAAEPAMPLPARTCPAAGRSTRRIDLLRGKPFFFSRSMVFCISMHDARVRERPGRNYHGAETSELQ